MRYTLVRAGDLIESAASADEGGEAKAEFAGFCTQGKRFLAFAACECDRQNAMIEMVLTESVTAYNTV